MSPTAKTPGDRGGEALGREAVGPEGLGHVAAGEHEPAVVARDVVGEPLAVRLRAEQQEQPLGVAAHDLVGVAVLDVDPLQAAVATGGGDARRDATSTRGFHSISLMRYRDMVSSRLPRRTMIVTLFANRARWIAAWPAELPPPTTTTSYPSISRAAVIALP